MLKTWGKCNPPVCWVEVLMNRWIENRRYIGQIHGFVPNQNAYFIDFPGYAHR
jgi:hypothetical protein